MLLQNLNDVLNLVPAPLKSTALTCVGHQFTFKYPAFQVLSGDSGNQNIPADHEIHRQNIQH